MAAAAGFMEQEPIVYTPLQNFENWWAITFFFLGKLIGNFWLIFFSFSNCSMPSRFYLRLLLILFVSGQLHCGKAQFGNLSVARYYLAAAATGNKIIFAGGLYVFLSLFWSQWASPYFFIATVPL